MERLNFGEPRVNREFLRGKVSKEQNNMIPQTTRDCMNQSAGISWFVFTCMYIFVP